MEVANRFRNWPSERQLSKLPMPQAVDDLTRPKLAMPITIQMKQSKRSAASCFDRFEANLLDPVNAARIEVVDGTDHLDIVFDHAFF